MHRLLLVCSMMLCMAALPTMAQGSFLYKAERTFSAGYKAYEAATLTDEDIVAAMKETMAYEDSVNTVCSSKSSYAVRIRKITSKLTDVNGIPLNFKVYKNVEDANAFASPDGSIRVYSKLMDLMTDDELLGVIGHEIGHLACGHSKKAYKMALLVSAGRDELSTFDGVLGTIAASSFGNIAESMVNAKYSRDQEREADLYGYSYLKSCGKSPLVLAKALEKLQTLESGSSNKYVRYAEHLFSSHPDLEERIEILSEKAHDEGYK